MRIKPPNAFKEPSLGGKTFHVRFHSIRCNSQIQYLTWRSLHSHQHCAINSLILRLLRSMITWQQPALFTLPGQQRNFCIHCSLWAIQRNLSQKNNRYTRSFQAEKDITLCKISPSQQCNNKCLQFKLVDAKRQSLISGTCGFIAPVPSNKVLAPLSKADC